MVKEKEDLWLALETDESSALTMTETVLRRGVSQSQCLKVSTKKGLEKTVVSNVDVSI